MTTSEHTVTVHKISAWAVAPLVAMATFMEILDVSVANVALQHISGDLSTSQEQSTWILTSYLVTNAIILPLSGWFSSVLGRRRFFVFCILGFSLSSLLCGLSTSLPMLIVFRAIQGLTGGGLQPSAQAILVDSFPVEKRGMALAAYGMAVILAPAIGPTLGGWITDNYSWRWIFLINVPVGMILGPLIWAFVEDPVGSAERRKSLLADGLKVDYLGFALLTIGLGALQIFLDKGQQDDWFSSPFITALAIVSAIGGIAFIIWELGQDHPLVDIRLFSNRNFAACNLLNFALGFVLNSSTALLPQFVQSLYGYTATLAGEVLSPGGIVLAFLMPVIGKLLTHTDARRMVVFGAVLEVTALYLISTQSPQTDYTTFAILRIIQAVGLGFLFLPVATLLYVGLRPQDSDQAASISSLARNLGGSVGISVIINAVVRDTQVQQTHLIEHITPDSSIYQQWIASLSSVLARHGGSASDVLTQAQGRLYEMLQGQAAMLAYLHAHFLMALLMLVMIPLAFITKRQAIGQKPTALAE